MQGLKAGSGADRFDMAEVAVEGLDLSATLTALQGLATQSGGMTNVDPAAIIPKVGAVRFAGIDIDVPDTKTSGSASAPSSACSRRAWRTMSDRSRPMSP